MPSVPGSTFLTNHAHVLLCVSRDPNVRVKDLSSLVGISERAVKRIIRDLNEGGFISLKKVGRRNRYGVNVVRRIDHPLWSDRQIGSLLHMPADVENGNGNSELREKDVPANEYALAERR